jgi:hypothetical protein
MKYNVNEAAVKLRDGADYNLGNYVKGVDYVERKCFKTFKNMFRCDILGVSVIDPSKVEHKQDAQPVSVDAAELDVQPEDWRPRAPESQEITPFDGLLPEHCQVELCKIMKIHANYKWVETDKGRVFVGLKGSNLRVNQVIRVKNGELYLKRV